MLEKYGPVIGFAILMLIIVYARHIQNKQEDQQMNWLTILEKLAPIVLSLIPGIPPRLVPVIIDGITAAEAAGGSSQEKKSVAVSQVMNTTGPTPDSGTVAKAIDAVVSATNTTQQAAK